MSLAAPIPNAELDQRRSRVDSDGLGGADGLIELSECRERPNPAEGGMLAARS
jgi:hypothetical protein